MGGGDGEIGVWYTGVLGGIFMKISAMNETVCNHLFRDTPWRVSVRLTKTDRRGNLGVFANDFKLQLAERIRRSRSNGRPDRSVPSFEKYEDRKDFKKEE